MRPTTLIALSAVGAAVSIPASAVELSLDPGVAPRHVTLEHYFGVGDNQRFGPQEIWQRVCELPCSAALSPSERYRLRASNPPLPELALPAAMMTSNLRVAVSHEYRSRVATGGALVAAGVMVLAAGVGLIADSGNGGTALAGLGAGALSLGLVATILGLPILAGGPADIATLHIKEDPALP